MEDTARRRAALVARLEASHAGLAMHQHALRALLRAGGDPAALLAACRDLQGAHLLAGDLLREAMVLAIDTGAPLQPAQGAHRRARRKAAAG